MAMNENEGGSLGGFPWARYYDLTHGNPISDTDTEPSKRGSLRGRSHLGHAPPRASARTNQPPDSDAQRMLLGVAGA